MAAPSSALGLTSPLLLAAPCSGAMLVGDALAPTRGWLGAAGLGVRPPGGKASVAAHKAAGKHLVMQVADGRSLEGLGAAIRVVHPLLGQRA